MFTGLVEATGRLARRDARAGGFRVEIATSIGPLALGESVCVNGACLTVVAADGAGFQADVSVETHERTTLGALAIGEKVNLERSLAVGDRLGGHWVTGHVDGIATVASTAAAGEATRVVLQAPPALARYIAPKGSVALDGVSLTVNRAEGRELEVMLIPHTLSVTNLQGIAAGRRLNLEVDLVARYVVRYLEASEEASPGEGLTDALRRAGYLR